MPENTVKPSTEIQQGLSGILAQPGELKKFAAKYEFDFGSLYKIATKKISQPGVDYGNEILTALKSWKANSEPTQNA